jgi:hypothetical protein
MENTQQQTSECKTCKQKGPGPVQIGSIVLGFYILSTSIYGTIKLVELVMNFFSK